MYIKQGHLIEYMSEKWNIQADCTGCDIKNKRLLSIKNNDRQIVEIVCNDTQIKVSVMFDQKDSPIELMGIPADFNNISILICNTQSRIALYVNENLQDEDWSLGQVPLQASVCDFSLGDWIIHDDFSFNQNYRDISGAITNIQNIQKWKPAGHNTGVGDCMPFSHGDTFHLFYLFDRRGHRSKWGLGAHQWAHISTKDFLSWTQLPMAIAIDEQYEGSICTGSVVFHNGIYYAFYAIRMSDGSAARLSWSTSLDCINFVKSNQYRELSSKYHSPSARDPMVMVDEAGVVHMFVTTSIYKDNAVRGCLAHLISHDMQNWEEIEPLIVLDIADQPECPDYFYFNSQYYLIYSIGGVARYFMSEKPFGPWKAPENNIVINKSCRVPKTAKFGDERIMAAGFIVEPPERGYAGYVHFNEMIQQPDGSFEFVVPKELL